jgi:hypothetical protein
MYCEHCGLQIFPKHPVCTRCGEAPTLHWFQFTSLLLLFVAALCNSAVAVLLLPRFTAVHHGAFFFRAWLWLTLKSAAYGWVPIAIGLLAWDYFVRRKSSHKVKGWFTRKVLTFVIVAGVTPVIPRWVPAGQPPQNFLSAIGRYPGLPCALAWTSVLVIASILCLNTETREALLGKGKALSFISLGAILVLLSLTVVGWSLASSQHL